jgi:CheY-like chemotaxis protein
LKLELDQSLPTIEADLSQMRQVLVNIVLNASESIGDQDGNITIASGVRHMTHGDLQSKYISEERGEGNYVFLEVADSGCGMDEETLERVYDPFFTTKFTGRGLGLAAVLGIVRGHGGMITIASAPEQGTVLRTYFPVVRKPAPAKKASRPKPLQWHGEGTILLVDDEDAVKTVTATMLTRTGFSVIKADDGRQALELFREHSASIVCTVLDLTMPRMDGRETLTRLREINPRLPVLLCSGYDEQQAGINLTETTGVAFIQKPFRTPVFLAKLKELLDKAAKQ